MGKLEFSSTTLGRHRYWHYFLFGLLLPLSFAPFHYPGLAILGMALFYHGQNSERNNAPFLSGLLFGLGYFGFGISWIYISVHEYGHLHSAIACLITFLFLLYIALFPAFVALIFNKLRLVSHPIYSGLLFSALWCASEYLRASFFSGFPWLLLGFGQFDAPTKYLFPLIGVFGVGFITCFVATLLSNATSVRGIHRYAYLVFFAATLLFSLPFSWIKWANESTTPVSVGVIQANLSMRDKWDETLFWELLQRYQQDTDALLGTQLIVLPESALPLPAVYISDFLTEWRKKAKKAGSAILLGIPEPTTIAEDYYFNTIISLGTAKGGYIKQHLVPFGEYIPKPFQFISDSLGIPEANLKPGKKNQALMRVHQHPIAALICYELAYGELLRRQLPAAEWIVSISDDGWFGRSLAMYQQQQMAQVLSLQTARYQVVANNDGLSSVIDTRGHIVAALPAFTNGRLISSLFPATGQTPWVLFGDWPILLFIFLIIGLRVHPALLFLLLFTKDRKQSIAAKHKRRYPYQPY